MMRRASKKPAATFTFHQALTRAAPQNAATESGVLRYFS
ncbi:hypothetical protein BRCON_0029 [Candidatus Sumerlaea chitinivorans]|uniref:Uncharacterized protein n=1 Tax=Sumerlaea chitinivorans TaxID=2250252 RepID=A0A2Z4Y1K3_SUMC1|nr:hypothetical protein BRCON_0029 [Candidatus Sumerlaea chitinivorans]